jgi:hypothetical protein
VCGVETSSSIQYISPRSENDETQGKWFRSELYASGGVVLSENQDTVMCQVLPSFTIITIIVVIFIVVIIIKPSADRSMLVLALAHHQAFRMPEVVDLIRSISRGVVLQLNVTTLTPFAKVHQFPTTLHSARIPLAFLARFLLPAFYLHSNVQMGA